jgi:hypothetical protein
VIIGLFLDFGVLISAQVLKVMQTNIILASLRMPCLKRLWLRTAVLEYNHPSAPIRRASPLKGENGYTLSTEGYTQKIL